MLKKLAGVFLIFLFAAGSIVAQEMDPEAAKNYNEGNQKLKAGDYQGAIDLFDQALEKATDYRIYYQKGIALKKQNKHADAIETFQKGLELQSDYAAFDIAIGGAYYSLGQFQDAVNSFQAAMDKSDNPKIQNSAKKYAAYAYSKLGGSYLSNGNHSQAIETLNKSVELFNYDAAYLLLARAYQETSQWDNAITAAMNALDNRKTISTGGPHYFMGLAYKGKGDQAKAREHFQQAKSDATYRASAKYELGEE